MEDKGVKPRPRSNSARVLVFNEPKPGFRLEHRQNSCTDSWLSRKQSDPENGASNLVRIRKSALGKSAPSLSLNMKDSSSSVNRRNSRSSAIHRLSFVTNTSPVLPRSHSPVCGSPLDSPRTHTSFNNFSFAPIKRIVAGYRGDGRRWSVASLPSSGYGTTPGSSNMSSKCSSQERLHQLPHIPTSEDIRILTHHFSSNESNASLPSCEDTSSVSHRSPLHRPRSRSLSLYLFHSSSPSRTPVIDNEVCMMNVLYKERFPKATQQMEERLGNFIEENKILDFGKDCDYLPIVRFVHHQVLEIARDCLHKSQTKLITSQYFHEMSENLERLLSETKEKSEDAANLLTSFIKKLLLIISRPARLLECLEFDPEEFYHFLEAAEGQVKGMQGIKADIPQYIIQKLGLNRDPIAELQQELRDYNWSNENKPVVLNTNPTMRKTLSNPNENDFEIVKLISNGAYGAVYLVKHKQTRLRFAMKKINKNNLMLRNQVEQVFAERDILSFADNPFVVSMYCSFETKKHLCLVMEYVEGGDCASLLKNIGPLPADMARFYFAETVLAVEYLHSYGIVHRDLKPDNLLITALGHIKLTDFGLSKVGLMSLATNLYEGYVDTESRKFSDKQVIGTPEYIAPEVILRQGYGKPVDWWSMGIILYEFLIGCVPFFGETPEELFAHTVQDEIEWPENEDWPIQGEAKDLIISLLQHSPRDRLGTGGAHEIKEHVYFNTIDWNSLLRKKAEFIPQLQHDEDTSYFDSRIDRYSHELEDDTDDTDDSPVFGLFSSCSPQYKKVSELSSLSTDTDAEISSSSLKLSASEASVPGTPEISESKPKSKLTDNLIVFSRAIEKKKPENKMISLDLSSYIISTPESSQTDSDDVSPQINRRKKTTHTRDFLPKFSISVEDEHSIGGENRDFPSLSQIKSGVFGHSPRSVVRSASTSGLSLMIPADDITSTPHLIHPTNAGGGSSTASSRDTSPCRELSPLGSTLKPPIIIRRGPKGFGFTVHTIRVYYGDTDVYTMHHLVMAVDEGSPAFEAGLRPADLITHINGETVQGLYHTQVLQLLLGGAEHVSLRATPLEQTSIKTGGRKREPGQSKLARRSLNRQKKQKKESDKRRKTSLFKRISSKRASAEMQHISSANLQSPVGVTPSRSFQSFTRSSDNSFSANTIRAAVTPRSNLSTPDSFSLATVQFSSQSSSSESPSPTTVPSNRSSKQHYQRPSTLHGLKHKLHTTGCSKALHTTGPACSPAVQSRRKSVGHIPLSPLARTPSPSPLPASPTRSPSPLAFPIGHQPGSSNTTQSYSPSAGSAPIAAIGQPKKSFARAKSGEPGSPLLRRALSPDRLHPRSAESKCSISPLCSSGSTCNSNVKCQGRVGGSSSIWHPNTQQDQDKDSDLDISQSSDSSLNSSTPENRLSLNLSGVGELLPRIAEEKDSPTNGQETKQKKFTKSFEEKPSYKEPLKEENTSKENTDTKEKNSVNIENKDTVKKDEIDKLKKNMQKNDTGKKADKEKKAKSEEFHKVDKEKKLKVEEDQNKSDRDKKSNVN
ncbi:microtubule-associated serine/threonine-protein kinase 3 isoform X1 [Diorhabda carinulata]|uniref:microtubule-associated serine/threonine-protein kinase 3 isoform X1 n=1 Tax=Diorhabda carinulata TaxID=1163345 RepID=UPI0025A18D94|nr:microtubule-associated serine/threonine-protein kinase 3 isoform X1 [Diorhabda carinulata]